MLDSYFDTVHGYIDNINSVAEYANNYINNYKDKVKNLAVEANKKIRLVYDDCVAQISNYQAVLDDLNAIIGEIGNVESKGETWKNNINGISDTSTKQTMMSDYESEAQPLKAEEIQDMIDKVITPNKAFFEDLKTKITSIKYCDKVLATKYDASNVETVDYFSQFSSAKIMPEPFDEAGFNTAINQAKSKYVSNADFNYKVFYRLLNSDEFSLDANGVTMAEQEHQQFFSYLTSNFANADDTVTDENAGGKDALIDEGKSSAAVSNSKNDKTLSDSASDDATQSFFDIMVSNNSETSMSNPESSDPESSSDDDIASSYESSTDNTTNFLEKIANIASAGRDKLYLLEYMRNMFSCYTTNIDPESGEEYEDEAKFEKTLSGITISEENNLYYGSECEFILWGGTPSGAVTKTKVSIFAIRFMLNSIYAFTAPDIQSLTFQWATAIAGWTAFGVPIVQTVLTLALAMAESAYDLSQLCLGKSVPIYKSSTTWAMSPQGMVNIAREEGQRLIQEAAETAGDALNSAVTNIFDKIENTASDSISDISTQVNGYLSEAISNVSDQIINATVTPFFNSVKSVLTQIDTTWSKEKICEKLKGSLDDLRIQMDESSSDIYAQCKIAAINTLYEKVDEIADTIYEKTFGNADFRTTDILDSINTLFNNTASGYVEIIRSEITTKISELSEDLQNEVKSHLNSAEENVKEKLKDSITKFTDGISEKYTSTVDHVAEGMPDSNTVGDVSNSKSATISLNYKEYLYAFMAVGIIANDENMIARTGYLMQVNLSQKMENAGLPDYDKSAFDMTKMCTMVQIQSEAEVDSVFLGMYKKVTVDGEETYELDYEADGNSTNTVSYNGFMGY